MGQEKMGSTLKSTRLHLFLVVIASVMLLASCSSHTHAYKYNGLPGINGEPVEYQQTKVWALHALWIFPLIGDASLENSVNEFSSEARKRGAKRINIDDTSSLTYWFIFPPFSFFVHPVNSTISGNVEHTKAKNALY